MRFQFFSFTVFLSFIVLLFSLTNDLEGIIGIAYLILSTYSYEYYVFPSTQTQFPCISLSLHIALSLFSFTTHTIFLIPIRIGRYVIATTWFTPKFWEESASIMHVEEEYQVVLRKDDGMDAWCRKREQGMMRLKRGYPIR